MSLINDDFYANATKGTINCNSSSSSLGVEEAVLDRDLWLQEFEELLNDDLHDKQEEFIHALAKELNDEKSLGYYRLLVSSIDREILKDALDSTLQADKSKMIRTTKPVYFQGILRKLGVQTKFKHN